MSIYSNQIITVQSKEAFVKLLDEFNLTNQTEQYLFIRSEKNSQFSFPFFVLVVICTFRENFFCVFFIHISMDLVFV